jgi:hypothetical protein
VRLEGQKQREMSMSIPVIEQAKIQAQVLVPLIKAMQAELGEARANALVLAGPPMEENGCAV